MTFSAIAAGATGCASHDPIGSENPPAWSDNNSGTGAVGGGGSGGGGAGGAGGAAGTSGVGGELLGNGGFGANPPSPICPVDLPVAGEACDAALALSCEYIDPTEARCSPQGAPRTATCEQGQWAVFVHPLGCNPPPPQFDAGLSEDCGTEDEDAGS